MSYRKETQQRLWKANPQAMALAKKRTAQRGEFAHQDVILLLHGRTRFCNPDGSTTTGRPLRSIALIAWSDEDARILAATGFAGVLLTSWRQS